MSFKKYTIKEVQTILDNCGLILLSDYEGSKDDICIKDKHGYRYKTRLQSIIRNNKMGYNLKPFHSKKNPFLLRKYKDLA